MQKAYLQSHVMPKQMTTRQIKHDTAVIAISIITTHEQQKITSLCAKQITM